VCGASRQDRELIENEIAVFGQYISPDATRKKKSPRKPTPDQPIKPKPNSTDTGDGDLL